MIHTMAPEVGTIVLRRGWRRLQADPVLTCIILGVFALIGIFVIYPVLRLFLRSIFLNGQFSLQIYQNLFRKIYYIRPLLHSLHVGAVTALIGTTVAFIFAYALNRTDIPGKGVVRGIALLPIISPPFVLSLAAIFLFGRQGYFTRLLGINFNIWGFNGLVLTETLSYFPIAFVVLEGVLRGIDPALEESAFDLGASRLRVFLTVTLPLALPGLASALLLVFVESLADFGNPMVIGGRYTVLSSEAYFAIQSYNIPRGIALAILLLVPPLLAFLL
ncbi:MAG: ABC transporter permease subunit, partial [Nitrospinota bacterium]